MTALIVFALSYAAFAVLALSMARHQDELAGAGKTLAPPTVAALRVGGWSLLALALAPAVMAWGASVGTAGWLGVLTLAAMGVALQLTYAPGSARWAAPVAAGTALVLGLLA